MSHQIELPPELFAEWLAEGRKRYSEPALIAGFVAEKAAGWAADQQLDACCEAVSHWYGDWHKGIHLPAMLRDACRPKPPSLKEQALAELEEIMDELHEATGSGFTASAIRRALESIPDADKS